jgi:hypothetical protein
MVANKIKLNGEVIIDLTQDDVLEADVTLGKRFHKADGQIGFGTLNISGNLEINANGDYDVKYKESVTVKVPQAKAEIKNNVLYITLGD